MTTKSVPLFKEKGQKSVFDPDDYVKYMQSKMPTPKWPAPEAVIFCYQPKLLSFIKQKHKPVKGDSYFSRFLFLPETNNRIAVVGGFGVGAPAATLVLEEMIAFGVQKFISIGTAGSLQKKLKIGDLILCDRALRDEGVSYHYCADDYDATSDKILTEKLGQSLHQMGLTYHQGASWTIDAPYRETKIEVEYYQQQNILTVEMEASALMAVAEYRKKPLACLLTVSDSLADLSWNPQFHSEETHASLENIFQAALKSLLS